MDPNEIAGEDDRTIFLTFSRGYPVSAAELHGYFTRRYGDIIQVIHMGEDGGEGQAQFTRIVLHSADDIPEIFSDGGCRLMRFAINGKHVWARTFQYYGVSP